MDSYQLVASLVQSLTSLGWPLAIVGCVWLFRQKLLDLLPRLHLKHRDWEISFRLLEAQKDAQSLPQAATEAPPTPEELSRFEQIAKASPRAAILEYRASIDQGVREFARALGMNDTKPLGNLIRELRKNELIDQHTSAVLDDLRAIGNSAAHRVEVDFSLSEAQQFRDLAERVIAQLQMAAGAASLLGQPAPLPPIRG